MFKGMNISESQKKLEYLIQPDPLINIKPLLVDPPFNEEFLIFFKNLEDITKQFSIGGNISSKIEFSYNSFDFLKFVENIPEEDAKEIETVVVEQTKSIKKIITDIYQDNSNLLKIEPRQFEEMIAELLYSQGFKVELTKQTRDNGYDIIALKVEDNFPLRFLVECKRLTKDKVGIEIIRSFKEVVQSENANKGIIVTTSYFTRDARKKRDETPYLLDYRDKDDVLNWVTKYHNK